MGPRRAQGQQLLVMRGRAFDTRAAPPYDCASFIGAEYPPRRSRMRAFGFGCLLMWMVSILSAQTQLPPDHPPVATPDGRSAVSDLTERLRPASATPASTPLSRKNLIDEF